MREIAIRPAAFDDWTAIHAMMVEPRVIKFLDKMPSLEASEVASIFREPIPGHHRLVAVIEKQVIGLATLHHNLRPRLSHSGTASVMVHPGHWGKGIGTKLSRELLDLADNWLNLKRLEATVLDQNTSALSLCEKLGFVNEGARRCTLFGAGHWHGDIVMARLHNVSDQLLSDETDPDEFKGLETTINLEVSVRPLHPEDKEDYYNLMRHPLVGKTTLQMPSQEIWRTEDRFNTRSRHLHRMAAIVEDKMIGVATLAQLQEPRRIHCARIGMSVHPDFWGQGVGSLLLKALIDIADNWLDLKRLELDVNTDNPAGVRLYMKHGFRIEGARRCHAFGGGRMANSYFMARINGSCF